MKTNWLNGQSQALKDTKRQKGKILYYNKTASQNIKTKLCHGKIKT